MTLEEWQASVADVERVGEGYRYSSGGGTYHGTLESLRVLLRAGTLAVGVWGQALRAIED